MTFSASTRNYARSARPNTLREEVSQPRPRWGKKRESQAVNQRHHYLALFALIVLIIAAPACGPGKGHTEDQVATTVAQTAEAVPSATVPQLGSAPTDTSEADDPTPELEIVAELKKELYFGGTGGGGWAFCEPPPDTDSPAVEISTLGYESRICLFGFPLDERITVDLHAPNGDVYSADFWVVAEVDSLTLVRAYLSNTDEPPEASAAPGDVYEGVGGVTVIQAYLSWPIGLPIGDWHALVHSASAQAVTSFTSVVESYSDRPRIHTWPDSDIHPFENHYCDSYSAGERVAILGTNLEANEDLVLAIYHAEEDPSRFVWGAPAFLVYSEMVTTDDRGNFRTSLRDESTDPAGWYAVIVVTDLDNEYGYVAVDPPGGAKGWRFRGPTDCFQVQRPTGRR